MKSKSPTPWSEYSVHPKNSNAMHLEWEHQLNSPFYIKNGWIFQELSILAYKCFCVVLCNENSETGLFKWLLHIAHSYLCCNIIFISLLSFLSVHKRSSGDWPVPYACQAWWIRMAGDSRDCHLQHAQPTASVHHLCQLCAEVSCAEQQQHT